MLRILRHEREEWLLEVQREPQSKSADGRWKKGAERKIRKNDGTVVY